jgi:hypothetical protein
MLENPWNVILSPSPAILSEAKNLGSGKIEQLRKSFVVPIRSGLLRMKASKGFCGA